MLTLLRRLGTLPHLLFLLLLLAAAGPVRASHLLGGEMTYRYLDAAGPTAAPYRYEITVSVYVTCNSANTTPNCYIDIYNKATGAPLSLTTTNNANASGGFLYAPQTSISACTTPYVPPGCTIAGAVQPYQLQKFVAVVNLPASSAGYYAVATPDGNRNAGINNLAGGGLYSSSYLLTLYVSLAQPTYTNHSPVFAGNAVAFICANDNTTILNNAVDADGDRLAYALGQPYSFTYTGTFTPPPTTVPYTTPGGYTATTPLGTATGYSATIDPATGITIYQAGNGVGNHYTVAVDVSEYRTINGQEVLLGVTRRDVQLVVGICPTTAAPTLPPASTTPRSYTIEAGSTFTLPISSTQAGGHDLTLTATSVLLDGAGGYNATFAGNPGTLTYTGSPVGSVTVTGTGGAVSGSLVYTPGCAEARTQPYDVTILAQDVGCAGKTVADVFHITVVKPTGPTAIAGPASVCGLGTTQSYTKSGGTAPNVNWRIYPKTGGTFVTASTANPVQITWPTAGTYTLTARGVGQYGCLTDSVSKTITVNPLPPANPGTAVAFCSGNSAQLGASAVAGTTYSWSPATGLSSPTVANPTVTLTNTTGAAQTQTYTLTTTNTTTGCVSTGTVTVTVNPLPAANVGTTPRTTCSGVPITLGAAAVAGSTYSWSPATGLSSPTVANPTLTLPNTTGAATTQTYTLTETTTSTGCQATNTVTVTVNPAVTALPGAAVSVCSGAPAQLGATPVAGYTYSWSPATGLSSATVANPTVTLTNTTGAATSQTYTLTTTSATGCVGTGTVTVTVSPAVVAQAGAAVSFCSGGSAQLGAAPVAGYTYSWSPATGLSSATVANPTVTLTNTTSTPTTQTYTLITTSAAGCVGTGTVLVTVNPATATVPGAAVTICSGAPAQLGAAPVAGYTYSWSPATGLSSATVANPTVTLTNITGAATSQTYTLTTSAGSCTSTGTVTVTVSPAVTAQPGPTVSFCSGGSAQLGAAPVVGYTYSWSPATGLSSSTVANPIVTLTNTTNAATTQTYTLTTTSAAGCVGIATTTVTVNPAVAVQPGAPLRVCSGLPGQLGTTPMAGYSYSWTPATGLSNPNIANPTVTLTNTSGAASTQTYTLTTTGGSCTSTSTVAVTVNPAVVAVPGAATTICSGATGQLGAAAVAGYTYSWSPATGLSDATAANPTVTLTNPTNATATQTYTLTTTSAAGCVGTGTVVVTVAPLVTAQPGPAVSLCAGGTAQLGATPVAGYTYSWTPATNLSSATVANPTVTLTNTSGAATTTTYTLTATSAAGCVGTGTVAVTVSPAVTVTPGMAVTFCSGSSAQLGATPVAGQTYSWTPATGLSNPNIANPTVTLINATGTATTQTYTLTTNVGSCTSTSTVAVTVNPAVVAQPGAAVSFCSGSSAQLGAAPVAGYTYSWSPATGLSSSTAANPTVTLINLTGTAGIQTYTLTTTSVAGCLGTGTVTVTVNPAVTAQPGPAVSFCSAGSAQLGATLVAGYTYNWTPATGLSSATVANPTVTLTNTTSAATSQTYTLTTTSATGCVGTGTVTVTVSPAVVAQAGAALMVCSGTVGQLGAAPVAGYTYSWSPATGLSSSTVANPTVTLTNPTGAAITTTYTLTTSVGSCTSTGTVDVTVNPAATVLPSAAVTLCSGLTGQLGNAPVAGYTYSWNPATGLSSSTVANPTVTLTNTTGTATTQSYTLTMTSAAGCVGTGTTTVTVNPAVVAQPGAALTVCSATMGQLGDAPVAGYTYSWTPTTGLSNATVANPTVTLTNSTSAATTQTYTLTTTSAAGCVGTGTVAVMVNPAVTALPGAAVTLCSGLTGQLGDAPVAGYSYSWTPTTGLSSATVANPTVTLTNTIGTATTQTYTLTTTNTATGCTDTGTVAVTVNPAVTALPGAALTICSGAVGQLGDAPVAGLAYSWTPTTGLSNATVANPTVTLTNSTSAATTQTYTLTTTNPATNCVGTGTVAVTVNPAVTALPGMAVILCSGLTGQLGNAPVTGYSYSWSPATGLSSATIANPTVTLTTTTSAATTQTYTLTTTGIGGCSGSSTVAVTVNPATPALPGAAVIICSGLTGQLGDTPVAGYAYNWSPATGLSSATVANPTVTLTNTTGTATTQTYTLTTTNTATGCTGTGTVAVTVSPAVLALPGAAVVVCSGNSVQLGAAPIAGYTYSWTPATGLSSSTVANPTLTLANTTGTATTQTYTLTTTSAAGCVGTGTVAVTVNPAVITLPGAAVTICSGLTGQLGDAPVAGYSYSWSPATGLSNPNSANPTVTLTNTTGAATTQTYTLTTTNTATGCLATGTVVVTVDPAVVAQPGVALTVCSGIAGQLGSAPVAGYAYSWTPATGLSSTTSANPTATLTNPTGAAITQTYTLTTTSAAGCVGTATVAVTVTPAVTAQPGAAITVCSGIAGQLGDAPIAGQTYSWSPATGLSSATIANPTVTLTNTTGAATGQTYTLTTTSTAGCVGTGAVTVTVNPAVTALPGVALAICSGLTGQLGDAPVAGYTYSWTPATGLSSATVSNPTVTLTNTTGTATTQTYTLTTTNPATGCLATGTVVVTINPAVTALPGAAATSCSGSSIVLGATPVAGYTYSWTPATGLSSATAANPTATPTNFTSTPTIQTYTLTTTSAAGCVGTGSVAITVLPAVGAGTIGTDQTVCAGNMPAPLASTAGASGGNGTFAYQWESSPDNLTWTPVPGASGLTYAPGPVTATTYYRRRVTAGLCGAFFSNVVAVLLQQRPTTTIALATPPAQCPGTSFTFIPVATNAGPTPTYSWFVNNVLVASTPTFSSSALATGDQVRVELTATVGLCVSGTAQASITYQLIPPATPPVVVVAPTTLLPACLGAPVGFRISSAAPLGASSQYQWQVDGVDVPGATAATFTTTTLRDGQVVSLRLTTSTRCAPITVISNAVPVSITPVVAVNAGPNQTITEGDEVVLQGTANGTYPVTWTPTANLTLGGSNPLHPRAAPLVTTTYTLSAGTGSCTDASSVTVTVLPRIRIPNAFSPNGDGVDDAWQIGRIDDYLVNHVLVFNRWGGKVFESNAYRTGAEWNGTVNGQPAPVGTYYYIITLSSGKSYTGPLTIIY